MLRKVVEICEQQYGFMPRKSTTDAIFALRILMEKYRDGQKELHGVFVDLEKAYDRVLREELWYCMRKSGVAEKFVRVVQDMYERSRTVVRCAVGQTEEFNVEVGLHQGSALSPFLFAIVMDQLSEEVRQESPWTMMFADDIVICSESREQVEENLERWRFALERRGMKVSRSKTEYMCVNEREGSGIVRLQGEEVKKVVLPDDWETTAEVIRETGRKVLGVSSGRRKEDKETWWWNEEVQDSIQRKRLAKKKWDMDRTEENRQEYKELQRRVKREVSKAKQKAYDELYTRLDTREGEKDLYRLARQRYRDGKDVQQVRVIKDRDGRVLTSEERVMESLGKSFTRDELLDIRQNTPHNILPVFNYSDVLLDIVVGGAVALFKCFKKRKRGKRAGALVKLRQRGFRTVLPSIHLENLRSLPNKMDELLLLSRTNKDFSNSAALCFTESWLNDAIPDSALNLPGFQLFRADRVAESAGKSRGGGTCFYINERWCTDVTVLKKMCCPDLEAFFINCKPFYSPREFSSFILVSVYIPPQAHVSSALQHLADEITHSEQQHPDSVIIILGDFNKANLSHELPKFKQHISCPTRDKNILDHCYTTIKDAYRSVPRAALGLSDHCLVHLLPTYRPKLKSAKPVVRTVKRWTSETEQDLQACFECTDWSIFEAGATDLDELTETVTSYISFCEDMCIPTRTYLSFNNDKPWFTSKLRHLRQAKEDAFRNGDRVLYNQARNTLNKEIRVAKRSYAKKLENQFSANDPASVWKGLKYITNYKTPSPSTEANQQLAEDLNEFYCRFETAGLTPHAPSEHLSIQPLTPPATPLSPPPALRISEDDVRQIFLKQKKRKAPGPDGVTPVCLRTCADQLAFIFSQIFNRSLELCEVPACFKRSTIIPIPKKPKMTGFNDYRPVALTSVVMKSFERLVLAYLKNITGPLLDPLQFAYRANSSAFNTIIPTLLQTKLTQLSVPSSICQWITSFLTDRHQLVKLGKFKSNSRTTSTGAPQGCVLSPLLFSLYTNDCTSTDPSIKLLKFADDTTVIGLIQDGDESAYRQEIEQLAAWCSRNNLELNTLKTVEMIVDFRRNTPALPPLTIMNSTVPTVASFRLYFLRQLRKFNLPQELLIHFYSAVIESVLCTSITELYTSRINPQSLGFIIPLIHSFIVYRLSNLYSGHGEPVLTSGVIGRQGRIHPGWSANPSQGTHTMDNLKIPINLQCMSLDQEKPEYLEETPEAQGEHANSTHMAEAGIDPPTLEV
ncbi:hypothetical protein QTP70_030770 [Hemibagrus guttatus]|uniref:ribonuclease H n=1 Tax=Hemibagrus guttatus TaxID=175788 RepID=A0AAE0QNY8_9TELE|nr:hypothetical protein QTP70_030770 [Hemibagrus guttatus]